MYFNSYENIYQFLGKQTARARNSEIGNKDFELDILEKTYTTEH